MNLIHRQFSSRHSFVTFIAALFRASRSISYIRLNIPNGALQPDIVLDLIIYPADGIDCSGMIPSKGCSNLLKRHSGQRSHQIHGHLSGSIDIPGTVFAFKLFRRERIYLQVSRMIDSAVGPELSISKSGSNLSIRSLVTGVFKIEQ